MVDVRFNFDELLGRLGLIGSLGPIFVNKGADLANQLSDLFVLILGHKVLTALGSLHLKDVFLFPDSASPLHVFLHSGLKGIHFSLLVFLNAFIFLAPNFSLLFVILPLHNETQILLLKVCEVLMEVLWLIEGQIVLLVRAILIEKSL